MIKSFFKYLMMSAASLALVCACGENIEPDTPNGPEDEKPNEEQPAPEDNVPEGVLRIFADKTSISADGADCVTFKVMYGSKDVSNEKTMHLIREYKGEKADMENGANVFSATAPGEYKFTAYLYSGGKHYSDNEIVVTAEAVASETEYVQKVVALQFTSVGCVSCPSMSVNLKAVQEDLPGVLSVLAFHTDFQMQDPMSVSQTASYMDTFGFTGLPNLALNFRSESTPNNSKSDIREAVEYELETYPATCGVAIETTYDEASRELKVTPKITSNVAVAYKYHIFIVEDGYEYMQAGADDSYVHNNVVRQALATGIEGSSINGKAPFTPGVEVTTTRKVDISPYWNVENLRVVVAAMTTLDGGKTYNCNNANECKIGESVDYLIK